MSPGPHCKNLLKIGLPHRLRAGKHRRLGLMKDLTDPLHVIVMPMSGNDEAKARRNVLAERFKVVQRSGMPGAGIKAGVNYSPVTLAQMEDNTFAVTRPKNGNFQLLRLRRNLSVIPTGCHRSILTPPAWLLRFLSPTTGTNAAGR